MSKKLKAPVRMLTREDAESLLAQIGDAQRRVTEIEAAMNDEIAAIKLRHERMAAPYNAAVTACFAELLAWAQAHRDELCDAGRKTVRLATGEISWRNRPPSVRVTGMAAVIARLKELGLLGLVRVKEEIDKEAILAARSAVTGIRGIKIIDDVEDFVVKPFATEIERVEPVAKVAA